MPRWDGRVPSRSRILFAVINEALEGFIASKIRFGLQLTAPQLQGVYSGGYRAELSGGHGGDRPPMALQRHHYKVGVDVAR